MLDLVFFLIVTPTKFKGYDKCSSVCLWFGVLPTYKFVSCVMIIIFRGLPTCKVVTCVMSGDHDRCIQRFTNMQGCDPCSEWGPWSIYTLGKKGCHTTIEDNKTNVDRTFVFPLGWNWHDMDPWLFPNEIRHYLGQTFNARSSGIVELRNHSIGDRSPKSIFTLWQLWINICIFFQKFFLIVRTIPRPTPMGIRHEVFALAREGIKQGAIAARVGLTRACMRGPFYWHGSTLTLAWIRNYYIHYCTI